MSGALITTSADSAAPSTPSALRVAATPCVLNAPDTSKALAWPGRKRPIETSAAYAPTPPATCNAVRLVCFMRELLLLSGCHPRGSHPCRHRSAERRVGDEGRCREGSSPCRLVT